MNIWPVRFGNHFVVYSVSRSYAGAKDFVAHGKELSQVVDTVCAQYWDSLRQRFITHGPPV